MSELLVSAGPVNMRRVRADRPHARGDTRLRVAVVSIALVALVLSACGFHLQGRTPLPDVVKTPYLQTVDRQSEFALSLQRALITSGARPVEEKNQASVVVNIIKDEVVRRTLSVSAQNQPDEYELTYNVRFSVLAGDKELLPPTDISNVRSFAFAEQLLLAKNHEETILRQDMAHDLADMVMRRLASL